MLSSGLYRVTLTENLGNLKKGFSFNVASDSTGGPSSEDMSRAFYLATQIHPMDLNTQVYYSKMAAGNSCWNFEKIAECGDSSCKNQLNAQWNLHTSGVLRNKPDTKNTDKRKHLDKEAEEERDSEKKKKPGCGILCCLCRCIGKIICCCLK